MHQISEETTGKMLTTEEYLKQRQAAARIDKIWQEESAEETPYALKLAELICV